MYEIGSIVFIEDVIFKTTIENKKIKNYKMMDHAKKRPAMVLAEDDEYTYFLHITSSGIKCKSKEKIQYYLGKKTKSVIGGYIRFESIQKRPIILREEIMYIPNETLKEILTDFCYFQENVRMDDEYPKIKQFIYDKINEIEESKKGKTKQKKICLI